MPNYPAAGDAVGYVYPAGHRLSTVAYNNAKATGSFTVALATTTTITSQDIRSGDIVILAAKNAKASTMLSGGTNVTSGIYVSAVVSGSFTVTHDNHADAAGSIFYYSVFRNF